MVQVYIVPADVSAATTIGGSPVPISTPIPGQNASVTFSGTTGQKVSVSVSNGSYGNCVSTWKNPDGSTLVSGNCGSFDPQTLPQTGTYTIFLDPQGAYTGGLTLQVSDASDVTATATPGGAAVTVTTTVVGQDARVNFSATSGQRISAYVYNVTNPGLSVNLVPPVGTTQAWGFLGSYYGASTRLIDAQTLTATGTYAVWLQHQGGFVGSETVQVYNVPADASYTTTVGGAPVSVSTTAPGQNASVTFSGTTGQKISISMWNLNLGNCNLALKNPDGSTLTNGSCSGGYVDTQTLVQTGTHTIFLDPQGNATGGLTLQVNNDSDVTATATPGGSAVTVTTTAPGQDARVTFSATAGQRISFFVSNVTNPYIFASLIFPSGSSQSEGTLGSSVGVTSRFVDSQILSAAGTYTVLLAHGSTSAGSETVQVYNVPSDATGATTIGGSAVPITTTVPGQNGGVTFSGTTGQSVTVSLSSGTFTSCNLTLKNPDGSNLSTGSCSGSGGGVGPVTLGQTGTFTIFIDPQGMVTGSTTVLVH